MIDMLLNPIYIIIIVLPLTIACIAMYQGAGVHWSVILKDLGVPLGLIMAFAFFYGILQNTSDISTVGRATGMMLLALLYGGILASVGYFWRFRSESVANLTLKTIRIKWWGPSVSILTFLVILGWVIDDAAGLSAFFYPIPFSVSLATAFVALLRQSPH